jgi:phosphoribosylglycinamide formyltransferase-1
LPVKENDTKDSLEERIHRLEHKMYPEAIKLLVRGKILVKGRKVIIKK